MFCVSVVPLNDYNVDISNTKQQYEKIIAVYLLYSPELNLSKLINSSVASKQAFYWRHSSKHYRPIWVNSLFFIPIVSDFIILELKILSNLYILKTFV